jgi:hypothetical protein
MGGIKWFGRVKGPLAGMTPRRRFSARSCGLDFIRQVFYREIKIFYRISMGYSI